MNMSRTKNKELDVYRVSRFPGFREHLMLIAIFDVPTCFFYRHFQLRGVSRAKLNKVDQSTPDVGPKYRGALETLGPFDTWRWTFEYDVSTTFNFSV